MRAAVIDRELKHFRVDHNELTLLGRERVHQAEDHRVDAHGFTGTGRTRDKQMRHLGKVGHKGCAANIFTEDERKRSLRVLEHRTGEHIAEPYHLAFAVGQLYAHRISAGDNSNVARMRGAVHLHHGWSSAGVGL